MKKRFFYVTAFCFLCGFSFPQAGSGKSDFESGLFYFRANKPNDAIEHLEKALNEPDIDVSIYNYLGVSYFQVKDYQKAFETFKAGLSVSGTDRKILALNAGNSCFAMKNYAGAEEYYRLSLKEDENYISAVLNLSNTLVEETKYNEAIPFYEKFLNIAKENDPQRSNVEEILNKLRAEVAKYKNLEPELVSLDDVEYLNRLDAQEAEERKREVPQEKLGSEYRLRSGSDGIYIVKSERYVDDYKVGGGNESIVKSEKYVDDYKGGIGDGTREKFQYKIKEAELFIDATEFDKLKKDFTEKSFAQPKEEIAYEKINIDDFRLSSAENKKTPPKKPEPPKNEEHKVEKLSEEFYVLKIDDKEVVVEKENGEMLNKDDFDFDKFMEETLDKFKIEKGDLIVTDEEDDIFSMKIDDDQILIEEAKPEPKVSVSISDEFTPDGDGENDVARIRIVSRNTEPGDIVSWEILILDVRGGVLKRLGGENEPPEKIEFDGICDGEDELTSATDYPVKVKITLKDKSVVEAESILSTGILVMQDGDKYKIKVPNINFDPDGASMDTLTKEQLGSNDRILTAVAFALKKFQEYKVTVEGHANSTTGTEEEERKELIPLSRARAKAIMQILIEKGIERERLSAVGMGGRKPIATGEESWKNRRVEFILEK